MTAADPDAGSPAPGTAFEAAIDARTPEQLRAGGSLKWQHYAPALGAWVAETDFGTAPAVTRALHEAVDAERFGYLAKADAADLRHACSAWLVRRYGWEVPPRWISPIADVIAGLQAMIEHFLPPEAPIVLPTPAYMPFLTVPGLLGRRLIEVPMVEQDGRATYDLPGLAAALQADGGLVVHVNPHNPLGRVFTVEEQLALADVVERAGARVFADEIHAPLVLPGATHHPYASLSPATARHAVTATSASKAFNLPGLKTAQLIFGNPEDADRWHARGWLAVHGASTLGVLANTAAYIHGEPWLDEVIGYLDGNRRLLGELLAQRLPQVGYTAPEGTYLAWLDCRPLSLAAPAAEVFRERAGVAMVDGAECGAPGIDHVRLNFATPRPVLREIVDRLAAAPRSAD